jgi:hypothetical protein
MTNNADASLKVLEDGLVELDEPVLLAHLEVVSDRVAWLEEERGELTEQLATLRESIARSQELAHAVGDLLHEISLLPLPPDAKFHLRMAFSAAKLLAPKLLDT